MKIISKASRRLTGFAHSIAVANLLPVIELKQSTKRPHDGKHDQFLYMVNVKFFSLISAVK